MNDMNDIFFKKKVVDYDILLDMKYDMDGKVADASVQDDNYSGIDKKVRSTKLKTFIKVEHYPDICEQLLKIVGDSNFLKNRITYSGLTPSDLKVNEFNYLIYEEGDYFIRHRDLLNAGTRLVVDNVPTPQRRISTSTLISESTDFEGGELILFDEDKNEIDSKLEVGETIMFDSYTAHKVNPVTKGTREVLVAWFSLVQDIVEFEEAVRRNSF